MQTVGQISVREGEKMKKINYCIFSFIFSLIIINAYTQTSPNVYASLNGNLDDLISRLGGVKTPLHISGIQTIPHCYQQNRTTAAIQATIEAMHSKCMPTYVRTSLSHFQSVKEFIKRNPDGSVQKYIFFTGGDITQWTSNLMIAKQNQEGNFITINTIDINTPRSDSLLVDESDLWHPGGMDICGNYLAIPLQPYKVEELNPDIYRGDRLRIVFFDITNPENPQRIFHFDLTNAAGVTITCPAIAFTRLTNNNYLIACQYGYFVSRDQNINSGFDFSGNITFVNHTQFIPQEIASGEFQNLSFVSLNGQPYLIGTGNTQSTAPVFTGENVANVYQLNFNNIPGDATAEFVTQISYGKENCTPDCDFSAAANITSQCSMLSMYSWVWDGEYVPCCCFGPV